MLSGTAPWFPPTPGQQRGLVPSPDRPPPRRCNRLAWCQPSSSEPVPRGSHACGGAAAPVPVRGRSCSPPKGSSAGAEAEGLLEGLALTSQLWVTWGAALITELAADSINKVAVG